MLRPGYIVLALALAIVLILGIEFWLNREPADESGPPVVGEDVRRDPDAPPTLILSEDLEPAPEARDIPAAEPEEPAVPLPALGESDGFIREQVTDWPLPQQWVDMDDLLRRAAVVLENGARGDLPRRQLSFLTPGDDFLVTERGKQLFLDPHSYRRFDDFVSKVTATPPEDVAGLLNLIEPLLATALRELGMHTPPRKLLVDMMTQLDATPALTNEIELERKKVLFTFADPDLEALTPLQKQLLRMGPTNVEMLKRYARELRGYLVEVEDGS